MEIPVVHSGRFVVPSGIGSSCTVVDGRGGTALPAHVVFSGNSAMVSVMIGIVTGSERGTVVPMMAAVVSSGYLSIPNDRGVASL